MGQDSHENGTHVRGGQVGRRQFLKIAIGAGMVMAVEACSPLPPPAAQPTSAPAVPAAKPTVAPAAVAPTTAVPTATVKPSGTLTVAIPSIGNPTYVPTRIVSTETNIAVATFGETILGRNKDLTEGPSRLAESWSVSSDGKALTFDLRKGIKFHDGSDLTSEDVKFTLEQVVKKDSTNADTALWRAALDRIETPTPHRVVLHLKERNIAIPSRISGPVNNTQVVFSKSYIEKVGESVAAQKPVGTGPWKFVEYKSGELIRFEAVENHWRQTPAFKELVLRQVPEESTRVAMVLRGEADLAQVGVAQAKRLKDGGANLFIDPSTYVVYISLQGQYLPSREKFDPKVPWAADPADKQAWERARKVREAMNIAVDRKTIVDTVFAGQGVPATYVFAVPGSIFDDPAWKPIPYDPARAKQLLAEAGYPNGFEFPLWLVENSGRPGVPQAGEAVAQYWQAIGLRPKLQKAEYSASVRPGIAARSIAGTAYTYASFVFPEPAIAHAGGFAASADATHGAEYPPLDELMNKALASGSFDERKAIQLQMGKMVIDEYMVVPVAWVNALWGGSKRIKTFPRIPGLTGPYNFEYVVPNS